MQTDKKNKNSHYSYFAVVVTILLFTIPSISLAQYVPLTGIPGVPKGGGTLVDYINALFVLSVVVGALLAVIKIAIGGFQYMMSDIITSKESAKKDITGALLGLGILLASTTILFTINKNLINLDILNGVRNVTLNNQPTRINGLPSNLQPGEGETLVRITCDRGPGLITDCTEAKETCTNEHNGYTRDYAQIDGKLLCYHESPCPPGQHLVPSITVTGNPDGSGPPAGYECTPD